MLNRTVTFLVLLAICLYTSAQADQQSVEILVAEAQAGAMIAGLQAQAGDWTKADTTAANAKAALDAHTDDALKAAKGNAALSRAVKDFIVSASAYFDAVVPNSDSPEIVAKAELERLKTDMDSKAKMVELELKTAK